MPSVCADECAHFWCLPCTLVEERKILQQNGESLLILFLSFLSLFQSLFSCFFASFLGRGKLFKKNSHSITYTITKLFCVSPSLTQSLTPMIPVTRPVICWQRRVHTREASGAVPQGYHGGQGPETRKGRVLCGGFGRARRGPCHFAAILKRRAGVLYGQPFVCAFLFSGEYRRMYFWK